MKNNRYNPLQKLILVMMVLFASNAIAQTTTGQTAKKQTYSGNVVSPKASEAKMQKPATNPAHTTKNTGPVTSTNNAGKTATTHPTKAKTNNNGATSRVKTAGKMPAKPAAAPAKTSTGGKPVAGTATVSRKAQLENYIAAIDAKLPKYKGTAKETELLNKKATYQKELNQLNAGKVDKATKAKSSN